MLLSILIVNYNGAKYLEAAINSVLSQSCTDVELLVVDGDSKDESVDIIKKYDNQINWWISEPDKGQSDAFNKGFSHANGKYLMWLNADDLLTPNSLNAICRYLKLHPNVEWLTFNTLIINEYNLIQRAIKGGGFNSFCAKYYGPQVDSATSVFSKNLFERSKKFDLRFEYAMDIDLWLQFINLKSRYRRLNFYVYAFRVHKGSKTSSDGYACKPNAKRIEQSKIIQQKNDFHPRPIGKYVALFLKMLVSKPQSIFYSFIWKNKDVKDLIQKMYS